MEQKIIARNGSKILVRNYIYRSVAGSVEPVVRYQIWTDEGKYHQGISSEIVDGKYYVYCQDLLKIGEERKIIESFYTK